MTSTCSLNLKIYQFKHDRVPDRHCLTDRVRITVGGSSISSSNIFLIHLASQFAVSWRALCPGPNRGFLGNKSFVLFIWWTRPLDRIYSSIYGNRRQIYIYCVEKFQRICYHGQWFSNTKPAAGIGKKSHFLPY